MKYTKTKNKNRIWIISLFLFAFIVLVGVIKLCDRQDGYRTIKVVEVYGKVGVSSNGMEYEVYPGMLLSEGYSIITSTNSYVRLVLDDDKYIKLDEGSKAVFDKLGILGSGKTTISLERGVIVSEIVNPLKVDENYIVNTPNAILAVRGTMFKVEVTADKNGDRNTNVYTFGGTVSSQRIEPNGNVIDEQIIIEAGYKAKVKMDSRETIYVTEVVDSEEKQIIPIDKMDINEQDIVDMYFASKNGHELFIDTDEIENIIEEKQINIEEYTSVYEAIIDLEIGKDVTSPDDAETLGSEDESSNKDVFQGGVTDGAHKHSNIENIVEATCERDGLITISCVKCGEIISESIILATGHVEGEVITVKEATCSEEGTNEACCVDCGIVLSQTIIPVLEHEYEDIVIKEASCTEVGELAHRCACGYKYTEEIAATGHIHEVDGGTAGSHIECADCGTVLSTAHSYTDMVTERAGCTEEGELTHRCACGYKYTEEIAATGHIHEVDGGTAGSHIECADCGTVLSTAHNYIDTEIMEADCFDIGMLLYECACGHNYTEEVPALGHTEVNGGAVDSHIVCSVCGNILSSEHSYTITVIQEPSCDELGIRKYTCECGYSYTEDIQMEEHVEVGGGEAGVHKKCNVCGEVIEDGTYHYYTEEVTSVATCTTAGEKKYSCNCGYSYTEEVAALGHKKADENASVTTCERCGLDWADISVTNFEDETLRTNLAQYDTDNDGYLIGTELTGITNINLAGTADEDGGCMSLSGIEILPNVTVIDCSYNADLTQVNFSGNTKLYQLYFNNTGVESIDVSGCIGLTTLKYSDCQQLRHLDVSGTTLTSLIINSNPALQTLNVDGTSFTNLRISGTQITSLTLSDFSRATAVTVNNTPLQTVTISNCKLGNVSLNDISQLESVVATDSTISLINVSNCLGLKTLSVPNSGASVSFENDTQLEIINLSGTSSSTALELLGTDYTKLTSLDISNTSLNQLDVSNCTTLTALNVEGCESLTSVNASNTSISALDLTGCTSLSVLNLNSTQIETMANVVVPSNANISNLDVGSQISSEVNLEFDLDDITWFSSLTRMNVTNAKLSDTDWANIKSALSKDNLSFLYMSGNNSANSGSSGEYLTKLDLSGFMNIRELQIAELTDVTEINISNSAIENIDFSGFASLVTINASGSSLMELNATSNYLLQTIDVSGCTRLTDLWMNDTGNTYALNSMNLSGCSALVDITLFGCNNLTSINVEDCTNLEIFSLENCMGITSVDLTNNTKLTGVAVNQTGITTLDLSGKTSIEQVYAMNCVNLTTINLSNSSISYICLAGCNVVTSINVTGITNEYNTGNTIMIHYDGEPYDNGIFINDGSVTVEQEQFT